jgi:hypothetical protein
MDATPLNVKPFDYSKIFKSPDWRSLKTGLSLLKGYNFEQKLKYGTVAEFQASWTNLFENRMNKMILNFLHS